MKEKDLQVLLDLQAFSSLLSIQDSNLDWLIQSQMCYHYTNGQSLSCFRISSLRKNGCKGKDFLPTRQIFFHIMYYDYCISEH